MIEVLNLSKKYGGKYAVKDISFNIKKGEIVGFLGPNGAGKSTTMNILTGYISATEGNVIIDGNNVLSEPLKVKSNIGYLPEVPPVYPDMTVKEYLSFLYDLKKIKTESKASHIAEICRMVKIDDVYGRLIGNLSKGYKQRTGLAAALLGNPDVLILDEPTVGLDPKQVIEIRKLIKNLGRNHTVILSSHILTEIQAICDRVLVINKGEIVADGTSKTLSQSIGGKVRISIRIRGNKGKIESAFKNIKEITKCTYEGVKEPDSYDYSIETDADKDIRMKLFYDMAALKLPILKMSSYENSLEDIFLELINEEDIEDNDTEEDIINREEKVSVTSNIEEKIEEDTDDIDDDIEMLIKDKKGGEK